MYFIEHGKVRIVAAKKVRSISQLLPHASTVAFSAVRDEFFLFFFVCRSNISGTDEQICATFTVKTCLVPRSDAFECQRQRSEVKVTRDKNALCTAVTSVRTVCARCKHRQSAAGGTIPSMPGAG